MRKNILSLSIATMIGGLGFAGAATAAVIAPATPATGMSITDTGIGHILLVPYYSAQGANATLLNLVNTDTVRGKAVKLRFRGAANSDDLYDITILMSPGDVWTGSVTKNGVTGAAKMTTTDNTCTRPAKADVNATDFSTNRLPAGASKDQTLEGYVEILNVADIPFNAGTAGATTASSLYAAVKHNSSNVATCTETTLATLDTELIGATALATPALQTTAMRARGLDFPTGGLFANWTIVNLTTKATNSGTATAIVATGGENTDVNTTAIPNAANYVMFPQKSTPVLNPFTSTVAAPVVAATVDAYTADPLLRGATPFVSPRNYDLPDLSTPYIGAGFADNAAFTAAVVPALDQANALTHALATTAVTNEFITTLGTATDFPFSTDWVFSMPTRRYSVAMNYSGTVAARFNNAAGTAVDTVGGASAFFTNANSALNAAKTRICVTPGPVTDAITFFNREENTASAGAVVSPQETTNVEFCGETTVLTFNDSVSQLGAAIATQKIVTGVTGNMFYEGWASIPTRGLAGTLGAGATQFRGLPILGHAYVKAVAGAAGNLGGTWAHRTTKTVAPAPAGL